MKPAASIPPLPPLIYGRRNEIDNISQVVALESSPRVAILGGPGIGKTTLATAVLHDPSVEARFGANRFFVDCSGSPGGSPDCFSVICNAFGIVPTEQKVAEKQLKGMLQTGATLLVLDNFETMWEEEASRPSCETVLQLLADVEQLALIVTLRGSERPQGIAWTRPFPPPLRALDEEASRQVFVSSAAEVGENNPNLHRLLGLMEGVPLALVLIGHLAQYESLDTLVTRWEDLKTTMVVRSPGDDRLTSLDYSIRLSLLSPRMTREPSAIELLRLLALLPLGATPSDYNAWAPSIVNAPAALTTPNPRVHARTPSTVG